MIEGFAWRAAENDDLALIADSWLKTYRHSPVVANIRDGAFYTGHKRVVVSCLEACGAWVVCLADDPRVIVGWICAGPGLLHYVYVKAAFRRNGIALDMLRPLGLDVSPLIVTHYNDRVRKWQRTRDVRFDPYLLPARAT